MSIRKLAQLGWHRLTHKSQAIPVEDPEVVFPGLSSQQIQLGNLGHKWGHISNDNSLTFLCQLIRNFNTRAVLEFGTFTGRTTYNVALNLPEEGVVYTVDSGTPLDESNVEGRTYAKYVVGESYLSAEAGIRKKIVQIIGRSGDPSLSGQVRKLRDIDLVFIDGGHQYEIVRWDSEHAFEALRPGGVIVWDDYSYYWPGVERYLDELGLHHRLYWLPRQSLVVFKSNPSRNRIR